MLSYCVMKPSLATLILRIPSALHRQLKHDARWAETSLNKHCLRLLSGGTTGSLERGSGLTPSFTADISLRTDALQDLSARVADMLGEEIDGLVLFGSLARGQESASSDVDLLIILNKSVALDRDVYSRWRFGKFSGREIAPLFVQIPADGERIGGLWFEVALDGIVLFDRGLHVTRFLSRVRNLIASGRVRMKITHGHPYWVYTDDVTLDSPSGGSA